MTRELDTTVSAAVAGSDFKWVVMISLAFDSGTVYLHTGVGDLTWNSQTWQGVGSLASISGIVESADGGDDRINVSLGPLPGETFSNFVTEFTTQDTAGRAWFLYLAVIDGLNVVQGEASELSAGLTGPSDMFDGEARSVSLSLVTEAAIMRSMLYYRMTNEDQQKLFPGDKFCEFMNDLSDEIRWASADPASVARGDQPEYIKSYIP